MNMTTMTFIFYINLSMVFLSWYFLKCHDWLPLFLLHVFKFRNIHFIDTRRYDFIGNDFIGNVFIILFHFLNKKSLKIRVITKFPNSEQSYKGKVKTHKFLNRQISQQPENCENRNDPDLVQAFLKKWWVESDFKSAKPPTFIADQRFRLSL